MEFSRRYIIQCIGHAASNIRLKGEALENLSLLKNYIHKFPDSEFLFREMKKVTALSRIGIKLNEIYMYASSDRVDFSVLSKEFSRQSAELTTPLMFLLNDNSTEKLENYLLNIRLHQKEVPREETEENSSDQEKLVVQLKHREEFNNSFILLLKELNELLDNIATNSIEVSEIKHYISLIEEKIEIAESANIEIVSRVLGCANSALEFIAVNNDSKHTELIEKVRSAFIVVVVVLRGKDVDLGLYLEEVNQIKMLLSK